MMARTTWPWYCFLYRIAGAHGTFWLWIITLLGMWLFFDDMRITLLNRSPHKRSAADVSSGEETWYRWVEVEGTELVDAGRLFGRVAQSGSAVRLLLDPSDRATQRWNAMSTVVAELGDAPDSNSPAGRRFNKLRARFDQERDSYTPSRALRLVGEAGVARVVSRSTVSQPRAPSADSRETMVEAAEQDFRAAVQLVRENVNSQVTVIGVLDETPASVLRRAQEELGLVISNKTLRVGRRPRRLPLILFGSCALIFVFLAGGLQGILRHGAAAVQEKPAPPAAPPSSEPPDT